MANVTNADFTVAAGGFWISPTGDVIPVPNEGGHFDTIRSRKGLDYDKAYKAGYIRISFYGLDDYPGAKTHVTLGGAATSAALEELAGMLRHSTYPDNDIAVENRDLPYPDSLEDFDGERARDRAASWAMRQSMIKAKAAKAEALERVLEPA